MHKKIFISKVIQMTFSMIVFNISSLLYNIFISNRLGAETIGLFHLVTCVYSVGISLCMSGMSFTATRLLSDMPREKGLAKSDSIMFKCISISVVTSIASTVFLYVFARYIAKEFLGIPVAAKYIKMFSLCLTAVSVSAVTNGYFTAFGYVGAISAGRFFFLKRETDQCLAIIQAIRIATFTECISNNFFWRFSGRNIVKEKAKITYSYVLKLCVPIALGSYLRTGLSSAENLLIPKRMAHLSPNSLAKYGILKGMTMPILFFPSVLTGAFTSLLVPEIARRFSQRQKASVEYVSKKSILCIIKFGILVSAIFFVWSDEIGKSIFNNYDSGKYLHILSLLPLFLYVDSVTDAILKGANEQVFSLKVNTIDAVLRVILVMLLVPQFGINAYIAIIYISEVFNLSLSFWRLKKITALRFPFGKAVMSSLLSLGCAFLFLNIIHPKNLLSRILIFA